MITSGCESKSLKKMLCFITFGLIFYLLINPINTLAMNTEYLGKGEYWADKGTAVNVSNGTLNGCLKYELDDKNGCGYFYFYFIDSRADISENDDVYLGLVIENQQNIYDFTVSKDGVKCDNADYAQSIEIAYDFNGLSTSNNGGEIYVAFKLKNRDDLKSNNEISCHYSVNLVNNIILLNSVNLDMTPTTELSTTAKKPIEKTTKQTTMRSTKTTQYKEKESAKTKFTPKTTSTKTTKAKNKSSATAQTKFSPKQASPKAVNTTTTTEFLEEEKDDFWTSTSTTSNEQIRLESNLSAETHLSTQSIILIILAILMCLVGIILILIGVTKRRYKLAAVDEVEDENNKENNIT